MGGARYARLLLLAEDPGSEHDAAAVRVEEGDPTAGRPVGVRRWVSRHPRRLQPCGRDRNGRGSREVEDQLVQRIRAQGGAASPDDLHVCRQAGETEDASVLAETLGE